MVGSPGGPRVMRVHTLQHVPFEGPGSIGPWLDARGARVATARLYAEPTPSLPDPDELDWLVVMGGPMSANDEAEHPWLAAEKRFIRETIQAGRVVLGICLGAQLVAAALGARVFRNDEPEIGWFPVEPAEGAEASPFAPLLARPREVLHWHGDTFELPEGAVHLARSAACANQAFSWGDRVLGLQFHLEMTPEGAAALADHCAGELVPGHPWVQSREQILARPERFAQAHAAMAEVLEQLLAATR